MYKSIPDESDFERWAREVTDETARAATPTTEATDVVVPEVIDETEVEP